MTRDQKFIIIITAIIFFSIALANLNPFVEIDQFVHLVDREDIIK